MKKNIRIGTRASLLALAQANWIKGRIELEYPHCAVELVKIITKGDKIVDVPLAKVGGKGLFVKEIEEALLRNEIDLAVHSMKDVPTELPADLHIGIITERENPFDAFIARQAKSLAAMPLGAKVGTSSLRRKAQLARLRPDLKIEDLRGNLDTRLRKLDEGRYDAIILAAAGLNRLNLSNRASFCFSAAEMLPAVAQGAVGIELRREDDELRQMLAFMEHRPTTLAIQAERSYLKRLEGGCQVPLAGFATLDNQGQTLTITGLIASVDGDRQVRAGKTGAVDNAALIGLDLAEELLAKGGREILEEVYGQAIKQS